MVGLIWTTFSRFLSSGLAQHPCTFVDSSSTIVKADTSFEVVVEEARNESFNIEPEFISNTN